MQQDGKIGELKELIKARDERIAELEKEVEKLKLLLEELHLQLEQLRQQAPEAVKLRNIGGEEEAGKKRRVGQSLNWVVKQSHSNVFERLYIDAMDRIRRMEKLKMQFMEMQRQQLYYNSLNC